MKIFTVFACLLTVFFVVSCEEVEKEASHFDTDLQGTWKSNDPSIYSGTLLISTDRITITGYGENQTPPKENGGDDKNRPFKGFTKGTPLKGYSELLAKTTSLKSEEGILYIEDGGKEQEIHYTYYWYDNSPPDNMKKKFLRFTFGDRDETLENSENVPENDD